MIDLQTYITEGIFDIDDNIDGLNFYTTNCHKLGIADIRISVFSTYHETVTDKVMKKAILPNFSKEFDLGLDVKLFEKNIKIRDKDSLKELNLSAQYKKEIYNIIERVCKQIISVEEKYGDGSLSSVAIRNEMETWLKSNMKGSNHSFRYWRKSGVFQISFSPKNIDCIVRIYGCKSPK